MRVIICSVLVLVALANAVPLNSYDSGSNNREEEDNFNEQFQSFRFDDDVSSQSQSPALRSNNGEENFDDQFGSFRFEDDESQDREEDSEGSESYSQLRSSGRNDDEDEESSHVIEVPLRSVHRLDDDDNSHESQVYSKSNYKEDNDDDDDDHDDDNQSRSKTNKGDDTSNKYDVRLVVLNPKVLSKFSHNKDDDDDNNVSKSGYERDGEDDDSHTHRIAELSNYLDYLNHRYNGKGVMEVQYHPGHRLMYNKNQRTHDLGTLRFKYHVPSEIPKPMSYKLQSKTEAVKFLKDMKNHYLTNSERESLQALNFVKFYDRRSEDSELDSDEQFQEQSE